MTVGGQFIPINQYCLLLRADISTPSSDISALFGTEISLFGDLSK
jgi:hypothetical protein